MVRSSDNYTAELLVRELAVRAGTVPGTTEAGVAELPAALAERDVSTAGVTFTDGSGLDRNNRLTCATLDDALAVARTDPDARSVDTGLAVAGASGTLVDRFLGTGLETRVRAKTGSLDGVTGLVGVVEGSRPIEFAMIANGEFSESGGFALQVRTGAALAAFVDAAASARAAAPAPR
jgi:D-alanyl-D-alanine carboxypeptidase/D-alanyl-D-alanine-endopeptidase (penicillin-binding protein 4)